MEEEPIIIHIEKKKSKAGKVILITLLILVGIFALISLFFSGHYTYGTKIAGEDCSFLPKNSVYNRYLSEPMNVPVRFQGREGAEQLIYTDDFGAETEYDLSGLQKGTFDITKGIGWIKKCVEGQNIEVKADLTFDKDAFIEIFEQSVLCLPKFRKEPENAYLAGYDEKSGEFLIKEGYPGNVLIPEKVADELVGQLKGVSADVGEIIFELEEHDCYTKSIMSVDNAKLLSAKAKADKMLSTKISYDWNGSREIVDGSVIKDWLVVEDNEVYLDEEKVHNYVERTAGKNDTFGKVMTFRTSTGKNKAIERGDYGWKTDVEKETIALIEDVRNGEVKNKEPEFIYKGYVKGQNDVGKSYVEVDLTNQHVYLYINGKLDIETDCVSGNVSAGHNTPGGIYGITYKTVNATLRGPGYESFVYYWMPYNGGIGLHDATWRGKFGGTIYKYSGSHGCVNLPLSAAKEIYSKVEKNFPVVTYW